MINRLTHLEPLNSPGRIVVLSSSSNYTYRKFVPMLNLFEDEYLMERLKINVSMIAVSYIPHV